MKVGKPFWYRLEELPEYPSLNLEVCWVITWRSRELGFSNIGPTFIRYHDGAGPIYALANDWDRASRAIVRTIAKDPAGYGKHHRWYLAACRNLEAAARQAFETDLYKLDNVRLSRLFRKLLDNITAVHVGRVPGWVTEQRFERFSTYVLHELKRHLTSNRLPVDPAQSFSTLTTPTRRTLTNEEMEAVLRLAALPGQPSRASLKKHLEKYWFLTYGLVGPGMTMAELRQRIHDAKRVGDPRVALRSRKRQQQKLLEDRRRLLKMMQLSPRLRRLLRIAELIGYEKGLGKEIQFRGHAALARIGGEAGRRFGYTLRQFRWMLPVEVTDLLETGLGPSKQELNRRWEDSGLLINTKGLFFLRGKELRKFLSRNKLEEPTEVVGPVREFRGTPARAGLAIGEVKVIESPKEMRKMRPGNILVSHMTIPEVVPAMRIAGAVVTDMGGLTCHAAIVSRELGIPCVIGTKIATKVLKDGDRVEVDATKGVVRKL